MNTSMTGLLSSVVALALLAAVVLVGLTVARSVFGTGTRRAAATEVAAKLVACPAASDGVLRRRFVRALTGQHVVMPSGQRLAFSDLTVRVAPEDLQRLDPDGDLDRLGDDAATLYRTHAEREGWATPAEVDVTVEVDPGLRSGWVPPARGTRRSEPVSVLGVVRDDGAGAATSPPDPPAWLGWDAIGNDPDRAAAPAVQHRAGPRSRVAPDSTVALAAVRPDVPTVTTGDGLRLQRGDEVVQIDRGESIVLGRTPSSPLAFVEPEVSTRHAAIRCRDGRWQVRDVGSTNGTSLDGEPVSTKDWTILTGGVLDLAGVRVVASVPAPGTVSLESVRGG